MKLGCVLLWKEFTVEVILPKCIFSNTDLRGGEGLRKKEEGGVDVSSFK